MIRTAALVLLIAACASTARLPDIFVPPVSSRRVDGNGNHYRVPLPVSLMFDPDMFDQDEVLKAAAWWNVQAGETVFLNGDYILGNSLVLVEFSWVPDDEHPTACGVAASAHPDLKGRVLGMTEDERQSAIRHELGHAIGFDHSASERCLMWHQIRNGAAEDLCPEEVDTLHGILEENATSENP